MGVDIIIQITAKITQWEISVPLLKPIKFAKELFEGAVAEREQCNDEELTARIEWMKEYIFNAHSQEETHSTN